MVELALFEPEIPQNTGTLLRLCACFDVKLHIIEPCGFLWSNRKLGRSAMDYQAICSLQRHLSYEEFETYIKNHNKRLVLIDVDGKKSCWDFSYSHNDVLLMGKESIGVPEYISSSIKESIFIPQKKGRSLNLVIASSIVVAESVRQVRSSI